MPPLILWTVGTLGALALAKVLVGEVERVNEQLDALRSSAELEKPIQRLAQDPESGIYRPQKS
jgi:hypothetical protein